MGQSLSAVAPSAGSAGIDVPELADLVYEKALGEARFLKTVRARHHDGLVLVKVFVKPYTPMSLKSYRQKIDYERKLLLSIPNTLPYARVLETETTGYLARQYLYNSLYDRLSTRPFLEDIEKKWLAFQLLCAVRDCHAKEIYHGDIKSENVLVTSWNWLYLADFSSSFKPVVLPDDNPSDFGYFFDMSGRRTCYVAPERFLGAAELVAAANAKLTWAMDVFSAGCVIAELFVEAPIFSLAQLYRYRRGEYDPVASHLSRILDQDVKNMVEGMICLDPQGRFSAEQILEFQKGKAFPDYFYTFLHQYMEIITDPRSGHSTASSSSFKKFDEPDERIDRVWSDFDKISYFLGHHGPPKQDGSEVLTGIRSKYGINLLPVHLNIPNHEHKLCQDYEVVADDGTPIFLNLVAISLRNTARASSRTRGCDLLMAFAERLTDEARLDRVLPYLVTLLADEVDLVAIAAIRSITALLGMVKVLNPVNAHVFLEYVLPRMQTALVGQGRTPSALVRATYASCLGTLATTARRFLNMTAMLRSAGKLMAPDPEVEASSQANTAISGSFDETYHQLARVFEHHTKLLIEDDDPFVRRAFLSSVGALSVFFGTYATNDIILTHLNTYLNDRDWMLKCAFLDAAVGIAAYLGSAALEEFMLPLMLQALADTEETVVEETIHALAELSKLGLLSKEALLGLAQTIVPFTMHPNIWIRESAADFIAGAAEYMTPADRMVMLLPIIKQYLKSGISPDEFTELTVLDVLKQPLTRAVFEQALAWAVKDERGAFWRPMKGARKSSFGAMGGGRGGADANGSTMGRYVKNEEDEQWLTRLRNLGLLREDEFKLLALREFIWRQSQAKQHQPLEKNVDSRLNSIIPLRSVGATTQLVLFEEERSPPPSQEVEADAGAPRTIADALMDASLSIDDPILKRKQAALSNYRTKLVGRGSGSQSPSSRERVPRLDTAAERRPSPLVPVDGAQPSRGSSSPALKHQASALDLLRKDSNKAGAATGTTQTNAFGENNLAFSPTSLGPEQADGAVASRDALPIRFTHSYVGNDPSILDMLDKMYLDNYPHDIAEFGPMVVPISRRRTATRANEGGSEAAWKPAGKLVATFAEHTAAVNRVLPSPDHLFFITGSDDGSVKIWDSARLERNIAHRSRQTYRHADGVKVVALCLVENTHCFVSCGSDGSVNVVKVETTAMTGTTRYGKTRVLREYQLPGGEFAVWCEHFKQDIHSVLILATNRSRVLAIDLRTMATMYTLENPVRHGMPTCFCIDRKRNWLCLATSLGVLDLWDLRFGMRLRGWSLPGNVAIHRVHIHPIKGRGKWVCVAGGTAPGEVTVWDLEKALCREIYRAAVPGASRSTKDMPGTYDLTELDDDSSSSGTGTLLSRLASTPLEPPSTPFSERAPVVNAMLAGTSSSSSAAEDQRDVRNAYILTGGTDRKLRFWDLSRVENSSVFSGLSYDESKPVFQASHPTAAVTLNMERAGKSSSGTAAGSEGKGKDGKSKERERPSRSSVISVQQQQLLQMHLDAVTDICVLESPYTMTVSVDRSGVIFVFR